MSTNIIKRLLSARTGILKPSLRIISIASVLPLVPENYLHIPVKLKLMIIFSQLSRLLLNVLDMWGVQCQQFIVV